MAPFTSAAVRHLAATAALTVLALSSSAAAKGAARKNPELFVSAPSETKAKTEPEVTITSSKDGSDAGPLPAVLGLNSYTFAGNVLAGPKSQLASHWVVIFCPNWWEPCQNIEQPFASHAAEWQGRLNKDLLSSEVRFAKVDCATDKVLCNAEGVDAYPTVNHYMGGERVAKWSGGQQTDTARLAKWLQKHLMEAAAAAHASGRAAAGGGAAGLQEVLSSYLVPGERAADILLALLALAASFRLVLSNPELWEKGGARSTSSSPVPSSGAGADATRSGPCGGAQLRRLPLPEAWRADRGSLEL